MKTLKTVISACLLLISVSAFAADDENKEKLNIDNTLNTYVEAVTNGKIDGLKDILAEDVKFSVARSETVINYTKSQLLNSLKESENVVQNCRTDYKVVKINSLQAMVKVIMKYEGFRKINYINLDKTRTGWKITNISSAYVE